MDYPRALDSSPEDRGLGVRDCELYYITGGSARQQKVKPKTWRILRHYHEDWSQNSRQLPLI